MSEYHTIIIGAGAAGLMAAAQTGRGTLIIDHAKKPAEKVRISGGGRCNFTNLYCEPSNFLSDNPHFVKSALARYSQWDFIEMMARYGITWHEKTLGQLFCDGKSQAVIDMLLSEASDADLMLQTSVSAIVHQGGQFRLSLSSGTTVSADNLVVASGGKSIPKMGATGFAYDVARQFGHPLTEIRPALVPLTFTGSMLETCASLAGTALPVRVSCRGTSFDEAMLFTHRGLSGPSILQISSFWKEGREISIDLLPERDAFVSLRQCRANNGRQGMARALSTLLPGKLATHWATTHELTGNIADYSDEKLKDIATRLHDWQLNPNGSEGYRTAEVTLGGVSTKALSSRTLESNLVPGLFFIGEAVDVTGWLGGFNFQWAWSSGWVAGQEIASRR